MTFSKFILLLKNKYYGKIIGFQKGSKKSLTCAQGNVGLSFLGLTISPSTHGTLDGNIPPKGHG